MVVLFFKDLKIDVVCPGCQYGISHRLPFQKSTIRASSSVLQLVHSDLIGLAKIARYNAVSICDGSF